MLPQNKSWKEFKYIRKPLACSKAVFNKYGKEIEIHEYIQEFKDGTIAKEMIQKAGGFDVIKNQMDKINSGLDSEITVDLNEDLFSINRKLKMAKTAEKKIKEKQELLKKIEESTKKTEPTKQTEQKGENE